MYNTFVKIIDGNKEAQILDEKIKNLISNSDENIGKLAIIQIGNNPSSKKYISIKEKVAKSLGIDIEIHNFDDAETKERLSQMVQDIVTNREVTGVIIQLPLPSTNLNFLLDLIPDEKDIDVLSSGSQEKDRKSTRLNPSHNDISRMPSSA